MVMDLKLLPMLDSNTFSQEIIIVRDWDKFDAIEKLPQMEIDNGFTSYLSRDDLCEEPHYGDTTETPYGERLTWVLAKDLKPLKLHGTAGAFVEAMDDRQRIGLYWC